MRIECTKEEWNKLHAMLIESHNTNEFYDFPIFLCTVHDADKAEEVVIKISGVFIQE